MKAQLFIKGLKEPIELETEEAVAAQALIGDAMRPADTPFSIEGIWSGRKSDMRFIQFPRSEGITGQKRIEAMNKEEGEAFEKEIEQDKIKAVELYGNNKEGEPRRWKWQGVYLARMGALKLEVVDVEGMEIDRMLSRDSNLWMKLDEKIRSYQEYQKKRDFIEEQKLKALDKMAAEVKEIV